MILIIRNSEIEQRIIDILGSSKEYQDSQKPHSILVREKLSELAAASRKEEQEGLVQEEQVQEEQVHAPTPTILDTPSVSDNSRTKHKRIPDDIYAILESRFIEEKNTPLSTICDDLNISITSAYKFLKSKGHNTKRKRNGNNVLADLEEKLPDPPNLKEFEIKMTRRHNGKPSIMNMKAGSMVEVKERLKEFEDLYIIDKVSPLDEHGAVMRQ